MTTILVVDDDPDFVEITRLVLRAEGYEVRSASSGDAALRAMAHEPPALVVLDVMMASVLDGLDLARRLSADAALARIPIVMVSSMPDSAWPACSPPTSTCPSTPGSPSRCAHRSWWADPGASAAHAAGRPR